jgi:hypothetical protein
MSLVLLRALSGVRGAALIGVVYSTGGCGDVPCVKARALDLWILGRGPARVERLPWTGGQRGLGEVPLMIDEAAGHAVWIADASALEHHEIATGARRRIETGYELLAVESPRR